MHSGSALPTTHPLVDGRTAQSALVQAYQGVRPERRPIWMMRQAGRSLPEYRAVRAGIPMLESCLRPELVTEITLQPVYRHSVDAAIFFSDIVVPLKLAGVDVDIVAGVGPVMGSAVRTKADVERLRPLEAEALEPIVTAVGMLTAELAATPLIGFAGAPFTLASYLIEGRPSRDYVHTKAMMRDDPEAWEALLTWAAGVTGTFLRAQAMAGASAVQLFDSWAGALTHDEYQAFAAPYSTSVMAAVSDLPVPRVHFGTRTRDLLVAMRDVGATVMGVDQHTPLDVANDLLGGRTPLQGNIDPDLLAADWDVLADHTRDVLRRGLAAPAHVVNLGHGVPKDADPDVLTRLVALVHEEG
ncbi:MAG: uroporphyrinogen decarboxylase [Actinomycetota bacterium]|nr:uroporphyrinogen decarboxylase [Actinomycetota bacterium]